MIAFVTCARYTWLCCYLWDDGESRSQVMKSNLRNINTINNNSSSSSLQDAEQSQCQRGFSSTSATNDTNLKENNILDAYQPGYKFNKVQTCDTWECCTECSSNVEQHLFWIKAKFQNCLTGVTVTQHLPFPLFRWNNSSFSVSEVGSLCNAAQNSLFLSSPGGATLQGDGKRELSNQPSGANDHENGKNIRKNKESLSQINGLYILLSSFRVIHLWLRCLNLRKVSSTVSLKTKGK